jgi:hypothetical protein
METVVLKAEDFKTVHNTLCELREVEMRLNEVINEQMAQRLHAVIKGFEAGLADAYRQDNAAFDRKHGLFSSIQEQWRFKSIWSIYEVEDFEAQHPFEGAVEICYRDHWGEAAVYETIPVEGSGHGTWLDLWRAADRCIQRSGDGHHIFIESFEPVAGQPHQLRLTTGS